MANGGEGREQQHESAVGGGRNWVLREATSGLVAGATTTTLLHPVDLLKVRFQLGLREYGSIVRDPRVWYRGFSANLVGNCLSWSAYFALYNTLKPTTGAFGAAFASGLCVQLVTNPVWVVKTRMCQDLRPQRAAATFRQELMFVLQAGQGWRGLTPGLVGILQGSVQMAAYEHLKRTFDPQLSYEFSAASGLSKLTALAVFYPYQVVRSRLQQAHLAQTPVQVFKQLLRHPAKLYSGLFLAVVRVLPASMLTFTTYEMVRKQFS